MSDTENYTQKVIYWVHSQQYSQQHWETVAVEMLALENGDRGRAVVRLAQGLSAFHEHYRDAVVKSNNLLHEIITVAFEQVDWISVAHTFFADSEAEIRDESA